VLGSGEVVRSLPRCQASASIRLGARGPLAAWQHNAGQGPFTTHHVPRVPQWHAQGGRTGSTETLGQVGLQAGTGGPLWGWGDRGQGSAACTVRGGTLGGHGIRSQALLEPILGPLLEGTKTQGRGGTPVS